jgi:hypothetical protein
MHKHIIKIESIKDSRHEIGTMLHARSSVGFIIPDHKCTSIFVHEVMIHIRLRDITVSVYYDQGLIFSKTNCICKQKPLFAITLIDVHLWSGIMNPTLDRACNIVRNTAEL